MPCVGQSAVNVVGVSFQKSIPDSLNEAVLSAAGETKYRVSVGTFALTHAVLVVIFHAAIIATKRVETASRRQIVMFTITEMPFADEMRTIADRLKTFRKETIC
jgi:hypothetical protein